MAWRDWLSEAGRIVVSLAADLCALAGAGLTAYGAALVYEPAGYLVGGLLLLALGIVGVVRQA